MIASFTILTAILVGYFPSMTHAHGRLLDPPSRMSAWRFGFHVPKNYNDHEMYCGGFKNQWERNGGKCGICGDPWQGPRRYERPGGSMVQTLVITRNYKEGQIIDVSVEVTANHLGWFEFRMCNVAESGGVEATQACLDKHILADRTGKKRFDIGKKKGTINFRMSLPQGLLCNQCVFQWKWHCGNNIGYGERQEEFYGCSDVSITRSGKAPITPKPPATPRPPVTPIRPVKPQPVVTLPTLPTSGPVIVTYPPQPEVSWNPYPGRTPELITSPPLVTLPPNILKIIGDQSRPLSERIQYYVKYQQSVNNGYSIWSANKVTFVQREDPNRKYAEYNYGGTDSGNSNNNNGNSNNNDNNNGGINGNAGGKVVQNVQANRVFCRACSLGCIYTDCPRLCPTECPSSIRRSRPKPYMGK